MHFWRDLWIGLTLFCCGVACFLVLRPSIIAGNKHNKVVALALTCAGYSASPGFLHMWFWRDEKYLKTVPVGHFVFGGLSVAIGALIYALKVPERFIKRKVDYIGNSHNIFHMLGIVGFLLYIRGSVRMYHERQLHVCPLE